MAVYQGKQRVPARTQQIHLGHPVRKLDTIQSANPVCPPIQIQSPENRPTTTCSGMHARCMWPEIPRGRTGAQAAQIDVSILRYVPPPLIPDVIRDVQREAEGGGGRRRRNWWRPKLTTRDNKPGHRRWYWKAYYLPAPYIRSLTAQTCQRKRCEDDRLWKSYTGVVVCEKRRRNGYLM